MWLYYVAVMVMQPYLIIEPCPCSKPWCTELKTRTEYRIHHWKKFVYLAYRPNVPYRQWVADTVVDGRLVKRLYQYRVDHVEVNAADAYRLLHPCK